MNTYKHTQSEKIVILRFEAQMDCQSKCAKLTSEGQTYLVVDLEDLANRSVILQLGNLEFRSFCIFVLLSSQ